MGSLSLRLLPYQCLPVHLLRFGRLAPYCPYGHDGLQFPGRLLDRRRGALQKNHGEGPWLSLGHGHSRGCCGRLELWRSGMQAAGPEKWFGCQLWEQLREQSEGRSGRLLGWPLLRRRQAKMSKPPDRRLRAAHLGSSLLQDAGPCGQLALLLLDRPRISLGRVGPPLAALSGWP